MSIIVQQDETLNSFIIFMFMGPCIVNQCQYCPTRCDYIQFYYIYVHGSVHRESMSIIVVQQDATLYSFIIFMFMGPCIVNQCQ